MYRKSLKNREDCIEAASMENWWEIMNRLDSIREQAGGVLLDVPVVLCAGVQPACVLHVLHVFVGE